MYKTHDIIGIRRLYFADDKSTDKAIDDVCQWLGFDSVELYLNALETEKAAIFLRAKN